MSSLLETGNVEDAAKTLRDMKPPKRYVECNNTTTPQPFYGPFSGTTRVSRCQKRTYGLYGVRGD